MKHNIHIRLAEIKDKNRIIDFLYNYWNEKHVFVRHPEIFDYYHLNGDRLSFIIAEDRTTKVIYGIHGYITSNGTENPDIWTVLWKVIPCDYPFLGIHMWKAVKELSNCRLIAAVGVNPDNALKIVKGLKQNIGLMSHFYRLGNLSEYHIAKINCINIPKITNVTVGAIFEYNSFDEFNEKFNVYKLNTYKPYKDIEYIEKRYFNHPINDYITLGAYDKNYKFSNSILVLKEIFHNNSKILRIIDFIGEEDELLLYSVYLDEMVINGGYEYVDFYSFGINEEIIHKMGFVQRTPNDENIIPNYFEPFVQKNVDIYFNTNDLDNFKIFKGDSDQDRPNILNQ